MISFISPFPSDGAFGGAVYSKAIERQLGFIRRLKITRPTIKTGSIARLARALSNHGFVPGQYAMRRNYESADEIIVLDTTILAWLAPQIRRAFPSSLIVVVSHNDEVEYWRSRRDIPWLVKEFFVRKMHYNERIAAEFADIVTHVTASDALNFEIRNIARRSRSELLPIALKAPQIRTTENDKSLGWVFVGSNYFANRQAIEALRKLNIDVNEITLVGGICESREAINSGYRRLGFVENLANVYSSARGAVALVKDGSGMKVKIAEALAHGLPVLVSPEASAGYSEAIAAGVVKVVQHANEVVAEMQKFLTGPPTPELCRSVFEAEYSEAAMLSRLKRILSRSHGGICPRAQFRFDRSEGGKS